MDIAPDLYKLAWRKNRLLKDDLEGHKWTQGLMRMTTTDQMVQFITLWSLLQEVTLTNQPDVMLWRWTNAGQYSAKSAYLIQFQGSFDQFNAQEIWKANAQPKHKFFAWQMVQNKLLTADRLAARNWPCNQICRLCDQEEETAFHLCIQCSFTKEVLEIIRVWTNGMLRPPEINDVSVQTWWNNMLRRCPAEQRKRAAAVGIVSLWNVWKERNRRVFLSEDSTTWRSSQVDQGGARTN
uniref:Reverse transcriptase zinc-binding domain-containing protein n=1 Tax=Arundo donax TaxID=35708 RepID=A0A0A9GFD1_ARUDO